MFVTNNLLEENLTFPLTPSSQGEVKDLTKTKLHGLSTDIPTWTEDGYNSLRWSLLIRPTFLVIPQAKCKKER